MKKMLYVLVILLLSFTIYSCAKKSDSSSSSSTTELEGTWQTSCHVVGSRYRIKTLTVSGTNVTDKWEYHSDSSCANDIHSFDSTNSSLSIGDAQTFDSYGSSGGSGAEFTMTVSTNTLTILNSTEVSWVNTNSYCGDADWVLNTAKSIVGKTCGSDTYWSAGTAVYGLYLLDGSQLFWDDSDSSYPSSVGTGTSDNFTKQ